MISPLWVAAAAGTTYLFGGIAAIPLIKAFAHNKLLRRKIVISDSNKELVKIAAANESVANLADVFSFRAFAITLGLALGLNLMYTLLVQRYFGSIFVGKKPDESEKV